MLKKIIALLFAILFLYQSVGYILMQQIQQKRIQLSNWGKLFDENNADDATLILNSSDTRIEFLNEHEIVFEGKQYDVKAFGNQLRCYHDSKEEKILHKLISLFSARNNRRETSTPFQEFFSKIFKKDYSVQQENLFVMNNPTIQTLLPLNEEFISSFTENISAPPPRV